MTDPDGIEIDDTAALADVTEQVARYEAALMANDVAVLDELFRHSTHTRRFGVGEQLYGFEAISAFRRARPGGAPQRRILKQSITIYGLDFATADIEFQATGNDRIGRQTQSWVRTPDGWRIVSAHVSFMLELT